MSQNRYHESLTLKVHNLYINIGRNTGMKPHAISGCLDIVQSSSVDGGGFSPAQSCTVYINAEQCQELSDLFAKAGRKLQGIEP